MKSPEFVLSTLTKAPKGSTTPYLPRARFCIWRGYWAEIPENKHNNAPQNPRIFNSELPTFTTDVRMQKVGEIFASSAGKADKDELVQGSGGGGPCEAVWWVNEPDKEIKTQWRIRGEAFVVGPDIESDETSSGVRTVKSEIGSRMQVVEEGKEGDWSWKTELDAHFGNLHPGMRGTFKAPPPGQDVNKPYDKEKLSLGMDTVAEDLHDPVARKNFRVVIIKPEVVEQCDITGTDESRRYLYEYNAESGEWSTTTTWP